MKEWLSLFWLRWKVKARSFVEEVIVILLYYRYSFFFRADSLLRRHYFFNNPFAISKQFLLKRGEEDVYAYGETPLTSLEKIVKECNITSSDVVYELGCGRGRGCFWLRSVIGCSVVGIDYVPEFIATAKAIQKRVGLDRLEFRLEDICDTDYSDATVLYLYGTCLDEKTIDRLLERFSQLPKGTKIITVSYPLTDYTDAKWIKVIKQFSIRYPWGDADIYLHEPFPL